jgi:hypothetical protein
MPKPLPQDRTLLQDLFRYCSENYDAVFKFLQRDNQRSETLGNCLLGAITPDQMEGRRLQLEQATNLDRSQGTPSHEYLLPYLDEALLAVADQSESFGREAAEEGNLRMHQNPWFCWMIVAGYDAICQGHRARLAALRDLRRRLELSLEGGETPIWNSGSGELSLGPHVIRTVRGATIAGNIRLILDEFERQKWPHHITTPKDFDSQSLRETVRRLNKGLSEIRFKADGNGSGVVWQLATTGK